jgi:hypothetical protein
MAAPQRDTTGRLLMMCLSDISPRKTPQRHKPHRMRPVSASSQFQASMINNLITVPQPNTGLLQAMGQQGSSQQDFSPTPTGQQQLASVLQNTQNQAGAARSDALKTSQAMATQAMNQITTLVTAAMGAGNAAASGSGAQQNQNAGTNKSTTANRTDHCS